MTDINTNDGRRPVRSFRELAQPVQPPQEMPERAVGGRCVGLLGIQRGSVDRRIKQSMTDAAFCIAAP